MKMFRLICCLLLMCIMAAFPAGAVFAQENGDSAEDTGKIETNVPFPKIEDIAGGNYEFEVEFRYIGEEALDFDLEVSSPRGWETYITPKYETDTKIKSINIKPSTTFGNAVKVVASAPFWPLPDPGEYPITLEASAANVTVSTTLFAVITAKYYMELTPVTERYNTEATAGKDNFFSLEVSNLGTGAIDSIEFNSSKPEGWSIDYVPEKIEVLEAFGKQTVDINIKPPPKTVAGDYMISVGASGEQESARDIDIRVTVETPTIWGWVGVIIIVIVFAGLVVIFMRFSRR